MSSLAQISPEPEIFDVIGIGFGPSNVSFAIALEESCSEHNALFLESSDRFAWHPGMILPDTTMQVSFLKDLANPRNPQSKYTFLNYLHQKNRLMDFANLKTFFPSRAEFHDYFDWCAEGFRDRVRYGHKVTRVELIETREMGRSLYQITTRANKVEHRFLCRSIVHSCGLEPVLPRGLRSGERIFHSHTLLSRLTTRPIESSSHVVVVGGGQSAAEVCEYLLNHDTTLSVTAVVSRFGYTPSDDSPFVNQIFDPEHVDSFFQATEAERKRLLALHASTNYAVAELDLIERLYWASYQDKVVNRKRFHLRRCTRLAKAEEARNGVSVQLDDLAHDSEDQIQADYVICATGFRPRSPLVLMEPRLANKIHVATDGMPCLDRDYRTLSDDPRLPPFYCIGTAEATHGLTSTLISNMAIRAGELAGVVLALVHRTESGMSDVIG